MSPLVVRRYRAERLLRDEFEGLRAKVAATVAARLRAAGAPIDACDLDACYSQAWQGLYAAVLAGERIDSPAAWLTLVTYRRAIDEQRSRRRLPSEPLDAVREGATRGVAAGLCGRADAGHDIAAQLDDRARLRELFEGLRGRLSAREQQAATLCYLQGLSRAEAAARMGVSESRMRKLMDGRGARAPGVAAKMGALIQAIGSGRWCEQQGSLMRGLAYGILEPGGERHRLALAHQDACPACRAYVLSLRGLAAVLPPAPLLAHSTLAAAVAGGAAGTSATGTTSAAAGGTSVAGSTSAAGGAGAASPAAGGSLSGLAGAALPASGAAGVGAAGGSWWLAGPLGAKLAAGCLIALGVGAGCVALQRRPGHDLGRAHRSHVRLAASAGALRATSPPPAPPVRPSVLVTGAQLGATAATATTRAAAPRAAATQASREFGPERPARSMGAASSSPIGATRASIASAASSPPAPPQASSDSGAVARSSARSATGGPTSAAQREFSPG
jgi:RNA polymerase sigma factor (sigma-70 family)